MQRKCGEHKKINLHELFLQKRLMIVHNQHRHQLAYYG
jgi:hypothetical protein